MFRIGLFHRFTVVAARLFATIPRNVTPLTSQLRVGNSISTTLTRLNALQEPFKRVQWTPMIDPVHKIEPIDSLAEEDVDNTLHMDSVLRKRRLKMKKHKLRKRRRLQRSLKRRLGKI